MAWSDLNVQSNFIASLDDMDKNRSILVSRSVLFLSFYFYLTQPQMVIRFNIIIIQSLLPLRMYTKFECSFQDECNNIH